MPFRIKLLTILLTVESLLAGCFSIRLGVYNLACMILLGLIIYLPWQKLQIILWMLLPLGAIAESIYLQNHQYHFILCNIIFAYHLFVLGGECIINRNGRIAASGPYSLSLILSLVPTYFAMAIPAESAWTVIVQPSCGLTIAFISWLLLQPEFSWVKYRRQWQQWASLSLISLLILSLSMLLAEGSVQLVAASKPDLNINFQPEVEAVDQQTRVFSRRVVQKGDRIKDRLSLQPPPEQSFDQLQLKLKLPEDETLQAPLYVKESTYDTFTGTHWEQSSDLLIGIDDLYDGERDDWITLSFRKQRELTCRLILPEDAGSRLLAVADIKKIKVKKLLGSGDGNYYLPSDFKEPYYDMVASWYEWESVKKLLPQAGDITGYTNLDEGLLIVPRIKELVAQVVQPEMSDVEKITALLTYLKSNYRYEKIDNISDRRRLENFLFEARKGHCTLFASAFALMLRAANIPSRVSIGLFKGEYDPDKKLYRFYGRNYHAWTELYLDNYGWIRIDATGQGDAADLTAEVHTPEAPGLDNANENIDDKIKASINYARWQYAVFVLFSFVILIISLIYWIMKKWTMPVFRPSQRRQDNLPFFQYFKQHFTRQGFPPKASQTAIEYVNYLKQSGVLTQSLDDMLAYYYRVRYAGADRDQELEKDFIQRLKETAGAAS